MRRVTLISLVLFITPLALAGQQPTAPHDTVRGAIRAVDAGARTLEVTTGVGFAIRVVRLQVPAGVPITAREDGPSAPIGLGELKRGDVIRASFGSRPTGLVAYTIERVGRMETGVESTP
jgi:hypothetical protein